MSCAHNKKMPYRPPPMCVDCGHRIPYTIAGRKVKPMETRKFPFWLWPFMLLDRVHARLMKHVPYEYWIGGEWKWDTNQ